MQAHEQKEINSRNLLIVTVLNFTITAAEVVGGLLSNSLALLSDALHNLGDGIAVLIAYIAHKVSKRPSTDRKTFGYRRVQILAALLNGIVLIVISVYLFYEAYHRFLDPEPIKGLIMFIVASIGLAANLVAVLILKKDSKKNLNVKAAYLHLLGDTLSSVAVIFGGLLIYFYEIYWIDPLITVLIGAYILKETFQVLKETVDILMQSAPGDVDAGKVRKRLESFGEISNVHHIHLWMLDDQSIHYESHIDLNEDLALSQTESLRKNIENTLREEFGIHHITIQFEYDGCHDHHDREC